MAPDAGAVAGAGLGFAAGAGSAAGSAAVCSGAAAAPAWSDSEALHEIVAREKHAASVKTADFTEVSWIMIAR